MDYRDIEDIDVVGYSEESLNNFVSINDTNIDKSNDALPETLRSMFNELTFIGAAYQDPRIVKRFADSMRPDYDFTTEANRFFYKALVEMGKTSEWRSSEYTINGFMADD